MLPKNEKLICTKRLVDYLEYNPDSGEIRWKKNHIPALVGKVAGSKRPYKDGSFYHVINFQSKFILAHRVAWFLHYGYWPQEFIDHINGNKLDNRICNLRVVSKIQNAHNVGIRKHNTSGYTGVYFRKDRNSWRAKIGIDGKRISLGYYKTAEEAGRAYEEATKKYLTNVNMRLNQCSPVY
jgi:hypothetical protein